MRGAIGAVAPMPKREALERTSSPFKLGQLKFGRGPEFKFQGTQHAWDEAFIGGGLSKGPGPVGCFYDENRRTTWILFDAGCWYTAVVQAAPIPQIAKAAEPEKSAALEDLPLVYTCVGDFFEDGDISARPGGYFTVRNREFSTAEDVDFLCPDTGVRVQIKDGVVAVTSANVGRYFKFARPNILQRLLRHPHGWFWITTAVGRGTRFNPMLTRAFWHPVAPVVILALSAFITYLTPMFIMVGPFLVVPVLWKMLYSPARLHLPRAFFDDGAERFFNAKRVHKTVKAAEFTLFGDYGGDS